MPVGEAVVRRHEQFYEPVSLESTPILCADDRTENGIRMFGGGANPIYQLRVMEEYLQPGSSANHTFASDVAEGIQLMKKEAHCIPGVHSQQSTENDPNEIATVHDDDIGCAWIKLRAALSAKMSDEREEILAEAQQLRPELFVGEDEFDFANDYFDAHERLATNNGYFSTGRQVAVEAARAGAVTVNVAGEHDPNADGEITLVPNESMNGKAANNAGLPAYDHASWATAEIYRRLGVDKKYGARALEIADLLDAINTLNALGVKQRGVRRP